MQISNLRCFENFSSSIWSFLSTKLLTFDKMLKSADHEKVHITKNLRYEFIKG